MQSKPIYWCLIRQIRKKSLIHTSLGSQMDANIEYAPKYKSRCCCNWTECCRSVEWESVHGPHTHTQTRVYIGWRSPQSGQLLQSSVHCSYSNIHGITITHKYYQPIYSFIPWFCVSLFRSCCRSRFVATLLLWFCFHVSFSFAFNFDPDIPYLWAWCRDNKEWAFCCHRYEIHSTCVYIYIYIAGAFSFSTSQKFNIQKWDSEFSARDTTNASNKTHRIDQTNVPNKDG